MKRALILLLCPLFAHAAEHEHAQPTTHDPETVGLVPTQPATPAESEAQAHLMAEHGAALNFLILGERFEQRDDDTQLWELQGWLGYDRDKLWFKSEGDYDSAANSTGYSEAQLLYSRAVAPFWDLQAGLRHDDIASTSRTYAVIGLMGLAPYWFEIDAAAFLNEHGDLSTRLEVEYELRFTQKLLLQPRLELNYAFADDPALQLGKGLRETSFGLRLRYEAVREFAPYVGVEWSRAYGNTANLLRGVGEDAEEVQVLAGLRFWY